MRKVKFIGHAEDYLWDIKPVKGQLYDEDYRPTYKGKKHEALNWVGDGGREIWVDDPQDWELIDDSSEVDKLVELYENLSKQERYYFVMKAGI